MSYASSPSVEGTTASRAPPTWHPRERRRSSSSAERSSEGAAPAKWRFPSFRSSRSTRGSRAAWVHGAAGLAGLPARPARSRADSQRPLLLHAVSRRQQHLHPPERRVDRREHSRCLGARRRGLRSLRGLLVAAGRLRRAVLHAGSAGPGTTTRPARSPRTPTVSAQAATAAGPSKQRHSIGSSNGELEWAPTLGDGGTGPSRTELLPYPQ